MPKYELIHETTLPTRLRNLLMREKIYSTQDAVKLITAGGLRPNGGIKGYGENSHRQLCHYLKIPCVVADRGMWAFDPWTGVSLDGDMNPEHPGVLGLVYDLHDRLERSLHEVLHLWEPDILDLEELDDIIKSTNADYWAIEATEVDMSSVQIEWREALEFVATCYMAGKQVDTREFRGDKLDVVVRITVGYPLEEPHFVVEKAELNYMTKEDRQVKTDGAGVPLPKARLHKIELEELPDEEEL